MCLLLNSFGVQLFMATNKKNERYTNFRNNNKQKKNCRTEKKNQRKI